MHIPTNLCVHVTYEWLSVWTFRHTSRMRREYFQEWKSSVSREVSYKNVCPSLYSGGIIVRLPQTTLRLTFIQCKVWWLEIYCLKPSQHWVIDSSSCLCYLFGDWCHIYVSINLAKRHPFQATPHALSPAVEFSQTVSEDICSLLPHFPHPLIHLHSITRAVHDTPIIQWLYI